MTILFNDSRLLTADMCHGLWSGDGYAHYPVFLVEERERLLKGMISDGLLGPPKDQVAIGHLNDEGVLDGLLWAQRFDWGEQCFQIGMVHIQAFLVDNIASSMGTEIHQALFSRFLDWARENAFRHVACRLPVQNTATIAFLEARGFQCMDSMVCYLVFHRTAKILARFRSLYQVRPFESQDATLLHELIRTRFSVSRFAVDNRLPAAGKEAFFHSWTQRFYSGDLADHVMVALDRKGTVVGFLGYQRNPAIKRHLGRNVVSGGLGAAAPHAKGAYPALLKAGILQGAHRFQFAELETQTRNEEVIGIWERLGCLKVRESKIYHFWMVPD